MVNFGPLAAEICWWVWDTPANFNGFRVLAALVHGTLVVGISQTCSIEQRAPPIFGRAVITLGIGPHCSFLCFAYTSVIGKSRSRLWFKSQFLNTFGNLFRSIKSCFHRALFDFRFDFKYFQFGLKKNFNRSKSAAYLRTQNGIK